MDVLGHAGMPIVVDRPVDRPPALPPEVIQELRPIRRRHAMTLAATTSTVAEAVLGHTLMERDDLAEDMRLYILDQSLMRFATFVLDISMRFHFEKEIASYALKYAIGEVPRPPHWFGYRIKPVQIEFWHDRPFRLHDRVVFRRDQPEGGWTKQRLFP